MIFFRATNSINIKITDGTILKYNRFKAPIGIENETIYLTTYDDFNDLKDIFAKVDKSKYNAKIINEQSVLKNPSFPTQLGVIIENESIERLELKDLRFLELKEQNFLNQLKSFHKNPCLNFHSYNFHYVITDYIQKALHQFDMHIGGTLGSNIGIAETDKTKFIISSIMEEAISSSQLEGASTTRKKAKEMIEQDKKPKNKSEKMILNNFVLTLAK